jgi:hypothetical protein
MSEERPLKTNFMDNQAREISQPAFGGGAKKIVLAVVLLALAFALFQVVMFFMNMGKSTAMRNVYVTVKNPAMMDGVAKVDMTINNLNPTSISNIKVRYTILGPSGTTVASDVVTIPDTVPAGDERTFQHVKLGGFTDQSARMHAELEDVVLGGKSSLTADQEARFTDLAATQKSEEKIPQLEQFIKEAPNFVPGYIQLGLALMATNEYERAISVLSKAVELSPKDGDAHYRLALALQHFGRREQAGKELRKALDLLPDDPNVQRTAQHFDPE